MSEPNTNINPNPSGSSSLPANNALPQIPQTPRTPSEEQVHDVVMHVSSLSGSEAPTPPAQPISPGRSVRQQPSQGQPQLFEQPIIHQGVNINATRNPDPTFNFLMQTIQDHVNQRRTMQGDPQPISIEDMFQMQMGQMRMSQLSQMGRPTFREPVRAPVSVEDMSQVQMQTGRLSSQLGELSLAASSVDASPIAPSSPLSPQRPASAPERAEFTTSPHQRPSDSDSREASEAKRPKTQTQTQAQEAQEAAATAEQREAEKREGQRIMNNLAIWAKDPNVNPEIQAKRAEVYEKFAGWLQLTLELEGRRELFLSLQWDVLPEIFHEKLVQDRLTRLSIEYHNETAPIILELEKLGQLSNLKRLIITGQGIERISESIRNLQFLTGLIGLDINGTSISCLPESIGNLIRLECLVLYYNDNLTQLPRSIVRLKNLRELTIAKCPIRNLPDHPFDESYKFSNLSALHTLELRDCSSLLALPHSLYKLESLRTLDLGGCSELEKLPEQMDKLKLQSINFNRTKVQSLPISLYRLALESNLYLPPPWMDSVEWMRLALNTQLRTPAYAVGPDGLNICIRPDTAIPFAGEHLSLLIGALQDCLVHPPQNVRVTYVGERAIDIGGLKRDFFYNLFPNYARQVKEDVEPILVKKGNFFSLEKGRSRSMSHAEMRFCFHTGILIGALLFGLGGNDAKIGNIFPPHFYQGLLHIAFTDLFDFSEMSPNDQESLCRILATHDKGGLTDQQGHLLFDMECLKGNLDDLLNPHIQISNEDTYKIWKLFNYFEANEDAEEVQKKFPPSMTRFIVPPEFQRLPHSVLNEDKALLEKFPKGILSEFQEELNHHRALIRSTLSRYLIEGYNRQCQPLIEVGKGLEIFKFQLPTVQGDRRMDFKGAVYQRLIDATEALGLRVDDVAVAFSRLVQGDPYTYESFRELLNNPRRCIASGYPGVSERMNVIKQWYLSPQATDKQRKKMLCCMNATDVIQSNMQLEFNEPEKPTSEFSVFHTCFSSVNLGHQLMRQEIATPEGRNALIVTWLNHIAWALPEEGSAGGFQEA